MIKIGALETYGWEAAVRGMRNSFNSWDKSDSGWGDEIDYPARDGNTLVIQARSSDEEPEYYIGPKDAALMRKLALAGPSHSKFMRMIFVTMDINAPLYWWKEFDTYKVGTTANSCSTMHTIANKEFTMDDFSHEHLDSAGELVLDSIIHHLNAYRQFYIDKVCDDPKDDWWQLIQLLPSSYNQTRTVSLNYEVLRNMYGQRKNHKLDEWVDFCAYIYDVLPLNGLIKEY